MTASLPATGAAPAQYFHHLRSAEGAIGRAHGRTGRALEVASSDIANLDRGRLEGAVAQADEALGHLAAAERYRLRHDEVPSVAREYAVQAARDIELGTRALRRAAVLVGDPGLPADAAAVDAVRRSLGEGERNYRSGVWLLRGGLAYDPALSPVPEPTPFQPGPVVESAPHA